MNKKQKPNGIRQPALQQANVGRSLSVSDVKPGLKYQAWIGYEWQDCEFPNTGFDKQQLTKLIKEKNSMIRKL